MRKRNRLFIILLLLSFLLVGCGKKNDVEVVNTSNTKTTYSEDPSSNINVNGSGTLECEREANAIDGLKANFRMVVTYKNGNIIVLHTIDTVTGDDQDALTEYEDAYKKISEQYKDIKYYDTNITRDDNSVIFDINVNYEKVDIDKVIEIEGNDAKMFKNGKAKLKPWLTYAKKFGTTCKGV